MFNHLKTKSPNFGNFLTFKWQISGGSVSYSWKCALILALYERRYAKNLSISLSNPTPCLTGLCLVQMSVT